MTKLVVILLYFGMITVRICGQMNSDPAPGRSPGPPGIDTIPDDHAGTLLLTKDDDDLDDFVDRHSNNLNARTSDEKSGPTYYYNPELDKTYVDKMGNSKSNFDEFAKNARHSGKVCKNQIDAFLKDVDETIFISENQTTLGGWGGNDERQSQRINDEIDVKIEIGHELFDTQHGISCGLMYKVILTTSRPHQLGEFAVETLSNGRPRGSFVGTTLGNKLPMSWFKTPFVEGINWSQEDGNKGSSSFERNDDTDEILLAESTGSTENDNFNKWTDEENFLDETKLRTSEAECSDNQWLGKHKCNGDSVSLWILNEFCDQEDSIQFRVLFRPLINESTPSSSSSNRIVYEKSFNHKINKDCELVLQEPTGSLDYTALPLYSIDCVIHFPSFEEVSFSQPPPGILIELLRLNVPCDSGGYIKFSERSVLCGKLEELSANERTYHFDVWKNSSVRIFKNPMFSLRYKLVDYCYNLTLKKQAGAFYIKPTRRDSLECFFRLHLPYGNRIDLKLVTNNQSEVIFTNEAIFTKLGLSVDANFVNFSQISNHSSSNIATKAKQSELNHGLWESSPGSSGESTSSGSSSSNSHTCLYMHVFDSDHAVWSHCINGTTDMQAFALQSTGNTLTVHLIQPPAKRSTTLRNDSGFFIRDDVRDVPSVTFSYSAVAVREIVADCAFGWIAIQQFCVAAVEVAKTWHDGELHCSSLGGHLASIRTEVEQNTIDQMLLNSPGYQDHFAYWVGGSDKNFEGDFRWTDNLPFQYTNWFPGWSQHGHYNKQPNDDGLSSQDCIELRRYFRTPPGIQSGRSPLSSRFMWNDRDCSAKNFLICERPMNADIFQKNWVNDCNKTVSLTKEHPRAAVWSPSFPKQYPDNANCFTTITAPTGYRIVLEFEELVIETEPGCTYDYLEITEPSQSTHSNLKSTNNYESKFQKSSRHNGQQKQPKNLNNNSNSSNNIQKIRKRSSYENLSLSYTSSTSIHSDSTNSNNNNNYNIAQLNFQNLLNIFTNLYKPRSNVLIQTPDYPQGNPLYHISKQREAASIPRRLCGDWSSKLKLLRYVSSGSYLGLHFVSDYSHHFGGFKAKAFMENTASECSDERLKPYNGSCYLFVSYPEVDWWTAQQVCRGVGAQLSSVGTADEQKFISTNIRNQLDYSPQLIYWLGAELEKNGKFEWTDDSQMMFEGWLPGQGVFDELPKDTTCLGLQWKMSPTPMLPSGLYWESQKCHKVGGYVCKKQQQFFNEFELNNETVTGTEGRLTSPGYPNSYPLNVDYWIRIKAPERSRVIVQFQKIDLEPQDECLYDYISVQNYDMISKIALEPGTNPIPMAMFTSEKSLTQTQYQNERMQYARRIRSLNGDARTRHTGSRKSTIQIQADMPDRTANPLSQQTGSAFFPTGRHSNEILRPKREQIENKLPHKNAVNRRSFAELRGAENAQSFLPYVRWCGSHDSNMSNFDFISTSNEVVLNFHSDYSVSSGGFAAVWKAIDISGCPIQTLTSHEGTVASSNYPHFLINNLNCTYVVQAPIGRKIWLEFTDFELLDDCELEIDIGHGPFQPFRIRGHVNEGIFVSLKEQIKVQIRTGQRPRGKGFRAFYRTVGLSARDRIIPITNNSTGYLFHLNYPQNVAENVDFTQHLVAPLGHIILLELNGVEFTEIGCADNSVLEVYDNYADNNGTKWQLCKFRNSTDGNLSGKSYVEPQQAPVYITSYLNTLHIRQRTTSESNINLNATVRIQQDINYKLKLASGDDTAESCQPNPCQFKGKCITNDGKSRCQCQGHFVGRFCGLTLCELEPCLFGKCELTANSFKCHCQKGYKGSTCEQKQRPCAENPCEGRGICVEKNGGFFCRCHAWWEGQKCERRMMNIPYKPLSERMLQEPFWLGLITVFVVLAVIGLVWCAKRHFPEKIEKLLADEADRNRPAGTLHGHHHHTSLREQLQFTTSIPQPAVNVAPGGQRSIFNRLGIRKPSILSLSSPNPPGGATARTFSLDDLLRPPPRRSPSPRKKRNNSTPVKKTANDKKQILQQLVSPASTHAQPKVSLDELIQMSEKRVKANADSESDLKETTFSEASCSGTSNSITRPLADPKLEKKVTFARLLSKVSAEMSSGSEVDVGHGTRNSSALSLPTEIQLRASSVPPSPCTNDIRSPHSTSSNPGSESLSSSELALADIGFRNLHSNNSTTNNRRIKSKVSSADSILAMFRNFASATTATTASGTTTSVFISPSTTPTASSPQDELPCDDDTSTTSSMHTPISFSSGPPDSPVFYRQTTIEVPVLDALNAHKSTTSNCNNLLHPPTILLEIPSNGINKCLSPIREMPTPMPSPALTPLMPRTNRSNSPIFQEDPLSVTYSDDDDKSSDNQISANIFFDKFNIESEIDTTPTDTATTSTADINKPLKMRLSMPSITIDVEPPSPEQRTPRPRDLVIPTLTVEQPSPTRNRFPMIIFPGSPPPQRASIGETSFMFPNKQQQKRLLKQFEKPTSLDLPFVPPMITITSNMCEMESDIEPMSPATKTGGTSLLVPPVGMCYLSPFTMCTRADRTISESNLSSSGYSSMASPGPSRCGSSNPLYPNEMDEPGNGHPGSSFSLHANLLHRKKSSVLASCKENVSNGKSAANGNAENVEHLRARSDSETFSDDVLLESNDEGIGTDHLDEKLDDGASKLVALETTDLSLLQVEIGEPIQTQMAQLQLPSIVIQADGVERSLSPVSSRSESPLSERAGMGRFSPHFFGRKDLLPFTDSDGLYDFPSSDGKGATATHQRRSSSKKRERKSSKTGITQSPTKNQLDIPTKEAIVPTTSTHNCSKRCHPHYHVCHNSLTSRKSPKRRPANRHLIASSSSSTESLTTAKSLAVRSGSGARSRYTSPNREKIPRIVDDSEDDIGEALLSRISPTLLGDEISKPRSKISRLRAIGNQIRFLRRLEKSIKRREKLDSPSDSCAEDNTDDLELDSPKVTSPLLHSPVMRTKVALCRQKRLAHGTFAGREADALKLHQTMNSD